MLICLHFTTFLLEIVPSHPRLCSLSLLKSWSAKNGIPITHLPNRLRLVTFLSFQQVPHCDNIGLFFRTVSTTINQYECDINKIRSASPSVRDPPPRSNALSRLVYRHIPGNTRRESSKLNLSDLCQSHFLRLRRCVFVWFDSSHYYWLTGTGPGIIEACLACQLKRSRNLSSGSWESCTLFAFW